MFSKSNLLASLVGGIFIFFGGYLLWGMLMADFFAQHAGSATGVNKENPEFVILAIGCLLEAFFISSVYSRWARGVHNTSEGFQFGALIGAFIGFGEMLIWNATSNLSDMTGTLVNGVLNVVFMGITGAIIALVYKATSK